MNILRWKLNVDRTEENALSVFTGVIARAFAGTVHQVQVALYKGLRGSERLLTAEELALYTDLTFAICAESREGEPMTERTIGPDEVDETLTDETWLDGSKQHLTFSLTAGDMELTIPTGAKIKRYWWVITANDFDYTLGGGALDVVRDRDPLTGPVQAGNIIPQGAVYDGGGSYELSVQADRVHGVEFGANDDSLNNDGEVISEDGSFTAGEEVVTLAGTPGAAVTARVRLNPFLTADVAAARFMRGRKGVAAIGNGVSSVAVSGLNLGWTPTVVLATIGKVAGDTGLILWASVVQASITADGFTVELSGVTDSANYKLHYLIL